MIDDPVRKGVIFEKSRPGAPGYRFPEIDIPETDFGGDARGLLRKEPLPLPELSELEVIRHFTELSRRNFGIELGFYPLGSCTMKYNPRMNEAAAALPELAELHPLQPDDTAQGTLEILYRLLQGLCRITGMSWGTLAPYAGAQGEFTGMKLFKAYFSSRGETGRTRILIPDSAHGTNPASAHLAGFEVVEIESDSRGLVDKEEVRRYCDDSLAGIMMTNPNTLGLFEEEIEDIAAMIHQAGGLLYYDGANFNAIMGKVRPGEMGFDCVHLNLHKTFSTPHGGGGPGAGPILVNPVLEPFLPQPVLTRAEGSYRWERERPQSIGRVGGYYGNVAVLVRAYAYLLLNGAEGLRGVSEKAVLNARYLRRKLEGLLRNPYPQDCMHEFVLSAKGLKEEYGVTALDLAKGLLDRNIHPPTIYFPLVVEEAMMIEPTETETKEMLDYFAAVMRDLVETARRNPDGLHEAPFNASVRRVDQVLAARKPRVNYFDEE